MAPSTITSDPLPLSCKVSRWYFWRVAKFAALFLVAGLWFGYDGLIGYPKSNEIAKEHSQFQDQVRATYAEMEASGTLSGWPTLAESRNWPTGENGEAPTWVAYAAAKGWPEKPPKTHSQSSIQTQLYLALGGILAAVAAILIGFLNRKKTLSADADSLTTPRGVHIPFTAVSEIDRRPWRTKGFARITYTNPGDRKAKSVIDDLKFEGANRVLERLESHFDGILIEEASVEEEADSTPKTDRSGTVSEQPSHAT